MIKDEAVYISVKMYLPNVIKKPEHVVRA